MKEKPYRLRLAISITMLTISVFIFIYQITSISVVQSLTYYKDFTSSLDYVLDTSDPIMDTNAILVSGLGLRDFKIEQYKSLEAGDGYDSKVEMIDTDNIQTIYNTPSFLVSFKNLEENPYDSDFIMQHRLRIMVFILAVIVSIIIIKNIQGIWGVTIRCVEWFSHSNLLLVASTIIILRIAIPFCVFTAWDITDTIAITRGANITDFTHLDYTDNTIKVYSQRYENGDEIIAEFLAKQLDLSYHKRCSKDKSKIKFKQYGYRDEDLRGRDINDIDSTKIPYSSCKTAPVISFNKVDMAREWAIINYFDKLGGEKRDWGWDEFICTERIEGQ